MSNSINKILKKNKMQQKSNSKNNKYNQPPRYRSTVYTMKTDYNRQKSKAEAKKAYFD